MIEKAIVLYIIGKNEGDPDKIFDDLNEKNLIKKIFKEKTEEKVKLSLSILPSSTIICVNIKQKEKNKNVENYSVSIPLFSSHFSFPLKIEEEVFILKDESNKTSVNIVDSYWISRPHNLNTSENTNYSRNHDLENIELIDKSLSSQLDDFNKNLKSKSNNFSLNTRSEFNTNKNINSFRFNTSPVFKKSLSQTSIRGLDNTIIQLGNSNQKGDIRIVAGLHESISYDFKNKFSLIDPDYENKIMNYNLYTKKFSLKDKTPYFYFYDDENSIQSKLPINNLKLNIPDENQFIEISGIDKNSYTNNSKKEYNMEGIFDDFSKIEILSNDNKSSDFYDRDFSFNKDKNLLNIKNELTSSNKQTVTGSINIKYFKNDIFLQGNDNLPAINLISSNLRFLSKPRITDKGDSTYGENESGEILFLKNSFNNENTARINITKESNILIDGKNILIGSVNRESNFKNGEGSLVMLGPSDTMESLVLGYQLKDMLLELFNINKEYLEKINETVNSLNKTSEELYDLIKQTNDTSANLSKKVGNALSSLGAPGVLLLEDLEYINVRSKINTSTKTTEGKFKNSKTILENNTVATGSNSQNRIDNLINKIDIILSKFSKTS